MWPGFLVHREVLNSQKNMIYQNRNIKEKDNVNIDGCGNYFLGLAIQKKNNFSKKTYSSKYVLKFY